MRFDRIDKAILFVGVVAGVGYFVNYMFFSEDKNPTFHHVGINTIGQTMGINTIGQSLGCGNLQLRSEPPNPQIQVSPWLQSSYGPDLMRRPLEIQKF